MNVVYPRNTIRTLDGAAWLSILVGSAMLLLLAARTVMSARPLSQLLLPVLLVVMTLGMDFRIFRILRSLERQHKEVDDAMVGLFDLFLMVPLIGLAGVLAIVRFM